MWWDRINYGGLGLEDPSDGYRQHRQETFLDFDPVNCDEPLYQDIAKDLAAEPEPYPGLNSERHNR